MSVYQLQKLMFHTHTRPQCRQRCLADREAFSANYDLTDIERDALLKLDVQQLYRLGVHPLLLRPFTELNGLTSVEHYAQLRAGGS